MRIQSVFLVGICVLFAIGVYMLNVSLPTLQILFTSGAKSSPNFGKQVEDSSTKLVEPEVHIETEYYTIYGETAYEVSDTMSTVSPIWIHRRQARASTHWPVNWLIWWDESVDSCRIRSVKTYVNIKYTLPKWKNFRAAQLELQRKWKTFMKSLIRHEEGHKNIAVDAAREIQQSILEMEPRPSCAELHQDANELGVEILWKYDELQKEFDADEQRHYYERGLAFP